MQVCDTKVLELKYSDQWKSEEFIEKDFYTRDKSDDVDVNSMPSLKLRLEELLKNNAVLREQISEVLSNKENMKQQDLVAEIWNIIFSPWIVPSTMTTQATITATSFSSESDSFSSSTLSSIKIHRTRRTTKYKKRGSCKNPLKKHLSTRR